MALNTAQRGHGSGTRAETEECHLVGPQLGVHMSGNWKFLLLCISVNDTESSMNIVIGFTSKFQQVREFTNMESVNNEII